MSCASELPTPRSAAKHQYADHTPGQNVRRHRTDQDSFDSLELELARYRLTNRDAGNDERQDAYKGTRLDVEGPVHPSDPRLALIATV